MAEPHVVILGAGPAGVGAAYQLRRLGRARVTVLERRPVVGGNAGSFTFHGQRLDYGSHRLHPACDPAILADIHTLLGDDLLLRPRHGRIRLRGRWIHFPLRPLDLLLRLDPGFALGAARDAFVRLLRTPTPDADTFASVLLARLGPTLCRQFYFPYARKIWGRAPAALSGTQARRRVSADSFGKLVRKVLTRRRGTGQGRHFYYPRHGFGQISEAYAEAAEQRGATFQLGWAATAMHYDEAASQPWTIEAACDGARQTFRADYVWSTLPVSLLARLVTPPAPPEVLTAAEALAYRAMLLVYLDLPVDRFTAYDAHYFPGAEHAITRLSEPKNYAATAAPRGRTILCAEWPCAPEDDAWSASDETLARRVADDLGRAGLPLPVPPTHVLVRRLRHAYPIYAEGYEPHFATLDAWAAGLPRVLTYGRQGLFAHDNTHHALAMAYAAADCLAEGTFDAARWDAYRRVFESHVVED